MTVKLVVIYPRPNDIEAFGTVYNRDHVPMAVAKLAGKTKIVATRVLGSPAFRDNCVSCQCCEDSGRPLLRVVTIVAAFRDRRAAWRSQTKGSPIFRTIKRQ
jgi:hypothetical protein